MRVLKKRYWPHRVEFEPNIDRREEMEQWLRSNVGEPGQEWTRVYHYSNYGTDYYFRNRVNAVMFALKFQ
jgi:hypothetical protein